VRIFALVMVAGSLLLGGCSTSPGGRSPAITGDRSDTPADGGHAAAVGRASATRGSVGLASYYHTAGLTAAHRTLPFGTRVRVTNMANGRSVIVRINDRGPFIRSRSIDLSHGAAQAVGMTEAGVTQVRMEVIK